MLPFLNLSASLISSFFLTQSQKINLLLPSLQGRRQPRRRRVHNDRDLKPDDGDGGDGRGRGGLVHLRHEARPPGGRVGQEVGSGRGDIWDGAGTR